MPVSRDGPSASAASAAATGADSLTSARSAVTGRIRPVPVTVSPTVAPSVQSAPNAASRSRICPAGCEVTAGQSAIVTAPPVTSAAARNGTALERSG